MKSVIMCTFFVICLIANCSEAFKIEQSALAEAEARWKRDVELEAESQV